MLGVSLADADTMNMPCVKRMTEAESIAEGERILAKDHSENIRSAERVRKMAYRLRQPRFA